MYQPLLQVANDLAKKASPPRYTHTGDRNAILALVTCWYSNLAANDCQSQKISFFGEG